MMDSDTASPLVATLDRIEASVKASKPVLISPSGTLTYGELFERGRRLAALFARRGLRVGDRVIILSRREPEAMTFFFALIRNGIAGVFLDPAAPKVEVEGLVRAAEPAGLVIDADLAAGLGLDLPRLIGRDAPVFRVGADAGGRRPNGAAGGSLFDRLLGRRRTADGDGANGAAAAHAAGGDLLYPSLLEGLAADHPLPDDIAGSATAYIMFTSGTTSEPKGVEISHRNVFAHLSTLVRQYGYDGDTRVLIQLPLHHTDGLIQGAMVALFAGAAVYRPGPFSVQGLPDLLDGIYQQRITHFYTVPTVLALIHRLAGAEREAFRTPEFRFVISSAGHLETGLWRAFEERFGVPVVNVYGLTETVSGSLYAGPDGGTRRVGTIGKPVDCECRVVDDAGRDVPPGATGELWLRGEHIMKGYFRRPDATAAVLDAEGWFRTGDLVTVDGDGFYSIVGRKKNVIITGGINVYPERVTSALKAHPDVADAVTFGVDDPIWGQRVVACVTLAEGADTTVDGLMDHARTQLSPESRPGRIYKLPELPRGPAGKPIIDRVRQMVASIDAAGTGGAEGRNGVAERVYELAAATFRLPQRELSAATRPENTPEWDSFAHLELAAALEAGFGISLSPKDIMTIGSLGDAERIVGEKLGA